MTTTTPEDAVRAEVQRIKAEHPYKGDYRQQLRALIEVLFYKFGERAGAARLVALLGENGRSPSSSTAQDEINKFWDRVRANSKITLSRPDLPPFLLELFGDLAGKAWENALQQAAQTFEAQRQEALDLVTAADARAGDAVAAAEAAKQVAADAQEHALEADRKREEVAVKLAAEAVAKEAAEASARRWEAMHGQEAAARAQEVSAMKATVEDLQRAIERLQAEQNRLLTVTDDYKQQAARDRALREKSDEYNRTLVAQNRGLQETIDTLSKDCSLLQGKLGILEAQHKMLQQDRDEALLTRRDLEQQAQRLKEQAQALQADCAASAALVEKERRRRRSSVLRQLRIRGTRT